MNRRRFLSFLGLAPVAAAVPAMALPRAEKPTEIAKGTFRMTAETMGVYSANIGSITAGILRSDDGKVICDLANHTLRFAG
ncbi:twin-arginine translocation signal domain-containing protein [Brucella tritici]|uniref:Twin-arginine translocation signal domain-containing protein n=1 Tax=Brucella tritici TaxID=94626 RepID=A0A7V7VS64_9HYPH|nr:twin-arginine translocation signal domain-containing protein [Brucella tritici]KAB2655902.1 twin-arginine translocation signal domain-containing protein [Brucella tritici]